MNETITSREELLLAKLAGENVDISTMTPPVAMNKHEKLLLDIATRLDGFTSGDDGSNSGSAGIMYIPVTFGEIEDGVTEFSGSTTASIADIQTAYAQGKSLVVTAEMPSGPDIAVYLHIPLKLTLCSKGDDAAPGVFVFNTIIDTSGGDEPQAITLIDVTIAVNDGQTVCGITLTPLLNN